MTIPGALQFMFAPGEAAWAPLPNPGAKPVSPLLTTRIELGPDFTLGVSEIKFGDDNIEVLLAAGAGSGSGWLGYPILENHGVFWNQKDVASGYVYAIVGGVDVIKNTGDIVALSRTFVAEAIYLYLTGAIENSGSVIAVSKQGNAAAFTTWWGDQSGTGPGCVNSGLIEAWSGESWAYAVSLFNGGRFTNAGSVKASGFTGAIALMTETHNSSIMNSGTIEAITGPSGHSIAIFVSYSGSLNLTNSGVISGGQAIEAVGFYTEYHDIANLTAGIVRGNILLENSHDILTNDGLIIGDVSLRAWDDIYNGGNGRIVGKLDLGDGDDAAASGLADDLVYGGRGRDSIRGNLGYDILFGGVGDDWIDGGDQSDQLNGEGGADTLLGQAANDTLTGAGQTDLLNGGSGSDILYGGDDNDSLFGDTQRDQIFGDAGDDVIDGGTGDDTVDGGTQRDRAFGGSGFDAMAGGAGNDTLQGGNDADTLSGGGNYDVLEGGDGDDVLDGGDLNDVIFGNAGNDRIIFRKTGDTDTIRDFAAGAGAGDVIRLVGFGAAFDTFAEVLAAATDNGQHTTIDFGGGDVLILRGVLKSQLAADDFVFG